MKVKIVKATKHTFWYAKFIGKIFDVKKSNKHYDYIVTKNSSGYPVTIWTERYELILDGEKLSSYIREEDSEILEA